MAIETIVALISIFGGLILIPALLGLVNTFLIADGVNKFRKHLRTCVVEDNCPQGDDAVHRFIEKQVLLIDQRFGLIGLVTATFVWLEIELGRMALRCLRNAIKDYLT
jgi:hypothetical protein